MPTLDWIGKDKVKIITLTCRTEFLIKNTAMVTKAKI